MKKDVIINSINDRVTDKKLDRTIENKYDGSNISEEDQQNNTT